MEAIRPRSKSRLENERSSSMQEQGSFHWDASWHGRNGQVKSWCCSVIYIMITHKAFHFLSLPICRMCAYIFSVRMAHTSRWHMYWNTINRRKHSLLACEICRQRRISNRYASHRSLFGMNLEPV